MTQATETTDTTDTTDTQQKVALVTRVSSMMSRPRRIMLPSGEFGIASIGGGEKRGASVGAFGTGSRGSFSVVGFACATKLAEHLP